MRAILLTSLLCATQAQAAARYWCGPATSLCTTATWACNDAGPVTNWTTASNCVGANASVPGDADDVFFDGVGGGAADSTLSASITINSLDMTGYANTLTHNASVALTVDGNGVTFKLAGTYTKGSATSSQLIFTGTSGTSLLTFAGLTTGNISFDGVGGGWQFQDAYAGVGATTIMTLTRGTLDTNGVAITNGKVVCSGTAARTLTLGASVITLSNSGIPWNCATTTLLVLNANTSTIKFTDAGATTKTFAGGGMTYNNVWLTGAGTGDFLVSGSNTFADFKVDTPPQEIGFTSGTTTTVTTWTVAGTAGNLMTLYPITAATSYTLTKAGGGTATCDYCSISYSAGTPATTWLATNSTNGEGNTGWCFGAALAACDGGGRSSRGLGSLWPFRDVESELAWLP